MSYKENFTWNNIHHNVIAQVKRYYETPHNGNGFKDTWQKGAQLLMQIIAQAEQDQCSVRAYGAGWSLSTAAVTNDYLVDSKQLKSIKVNFTAADFQAGIDHNRYFLAQCGTSVMEVNQYLAGVNKALETSGASDGQTLVGAMSTGTHGGAVNTGSMQDSIAGLHIITSGRSHVWIEGSQKVLSDNYLAGLMPGAQRINDDNILHAAIVAFGNFGIINGVLGTCVPSYLLSMHQKRFAWQQVKPCLNGPSRFEKLGMPPDPYHVSVIVNPFKLDSVVLSLMYKVADNGNPTLPSDPTKLSPSPDLLDAMAKISAAIPAGIPTAMKFLQKFVNNSYPILNGETQYPANIFTSSGGTGNPSRVMSTELGVDAADTERIADIIIDLTTKVPIAGLISFRFVKRSKATLAFTKFDTSCAIEFPAMLANSTNNFFIALWLRLENEGIAFTFHWGQCNNLNAQRVKDKWGQAAVDSWMAARRTVLPTPQQRALFSNKFLMDCGLHEGGDVLI